MIKTEELLKLAEAATPGPWRYTANGVIGSDAMPDEKFIVLWDDDARNRFNDFPLIAAANPATIKQLVELVRLQHDALMLHRDHYECEDTFYSCPADETAWEERKGECCCGADSAQKAIAAYERFEKGEG